MTLMQHAPAFADANQYRREGLVLSVAGAVGAGVTELAAFDDALLRIGVANFNLVRLSSVIPPASLVVEHCGALPWPGGEWGDRLYVVYAAQQTSSVGAQAWAGIGWVQDPATGQGLFVEHEGDSEAAVRADIHSSLSQLQIGRGIEPGPVRLRVVGGRCSDRPVCALALCVYRSEPWSKH